MNRRIVIGAGGTGGHLAPGLALAGALTRADPETEILFIGTRRGIEEALVPEAGYRLRALAIPSTAARGLRRVTLAAGFAAAAIRCLFLLARERPAAVVGMGGYASVPVLLAAAVLRLPRLVHEQNAIPGRATRLLARLGPHVALTFSEAAARLPRSSRVRTVGLPLREGIARFERERLRAAAATTFELDPARPTLLVFGGSQGARRLNDAAIGLAARWRDRADPQILLAAGAAHAGTVCAAITAAAGELPVRCRATVDRMEEAYALADLAICRAGGTVAELAATRVPSILVPYPYHRDMHQEANARTLSRAGAAIVVPDADATPERLGPLVEEILSDPERRSVMARAAGTAARPAAAEDLAAWVLEIAREPGRRRSRR